MRTRKAGIAALVIALLGTVLAAPSSAQQTSYNFTDDTPERSGTPWYSGSQTTTRDGNSTNDGYGTNNFRYTYVKGSSDSRGNTVTSNTSAYWDFSNVPRGRCQIEAYIPSNRATARVDYHIFLNGNYTESRRIDQEEENGWTTLRDYNLPESIRHVRVWLLNYSWNGFTPPVDSRGYVYNRIAVDALRLVCTGSSSGATITFRDSRTVYSLEGNPLHRPILDHYNRYVREHNQLVSAAQCYAQLERELFLQFSSARDVIRWRSVARDMLTGLVVAGLVAVAGPFSAIVAGALTVAGVAASPFLSAWATTSKFTFNRLKELLWLARGDCANTQWDPPLARADGTLNDDLNFFDVLPPIHSVDVFRNGAHPDYDRSLNPASGRYGLLLTP